MAWGYKGGIKLPGYDPLKVANAPTIGTATAGTSLCASVTFTAPACTGGGAVSSYTVFSNCGAKSTSGAASPLVVTGLTLASSYTFKVVATNAYGPSYPSGASNSVTATQATCATYTTAGTYSWVAPTGVTSVAVVTVGAGQKGGPYNCCSPGYGGSGAGLSYLNAYSVTPGSSYTVFVGATQVNNNQPNGDSYFSSTSTVLARGGGSSTTQTGTASYTGGNRRVCRGCGPSGGGGAGGYAGTGGDGGYNRTNGYNGTGGGGGGGAAGYGGLNQSGAGGGGVGLYGQGCSGTGGTWQASGSTSNYGTGGSGGANGVSGCSYYGGTGGNYGGGGGGIRYGGGGGSGNGGNGAVRIVWCVGGARGTPSFPSTNVGP